MTINSNKTNFVLEVEYQSNQEILKTFNEDIGLLPLAWNFYSEIKTRVKKVRPNKKDFFILCFPKYKLEK